MNELITSNETMTIKQIADLVGCSERTVLRKTNDLFPTLPRNGIKTILEKDEALLVVGELKATIKKQIRPRQNVKVPRKNSELVPQNVELEKSNADLKNMFMLFMQQSQLQYQQQQETNKIIFSKLDNTPKQIEEKKETLTVKEYCELNKIRDYNFNAFLIQVGRKCTNLSRELRRTINFKKEGEYSVSVYDIDIIKHCVEMVKIENEKKNTLFGGIR